MEPWERILVTGIGCCLGAVAMYCQGKSDDWDADALKSVTRVSKLNGLAQLLETTSKASPLFVSISGRVNSDTPINCERSGLKCVIMKDSKAKHFLKLNDAGKWIRDSTFMSSNVKKVPWYLDDGTARINVVCASAAAGSVLTVANEDFFEDKRLEDSDGIKMLGVKRTIEVLRTGTSLTVVGEAVKGKDGTIRVQQPRNGPFYVSRKTIDKLIADYQESARWCKYVSMGLMVIGVFLIATISLVYIVERSDEEQRKRYGQRRRHWEPTKRVVDAAAKKTAPRNEGSNDTTENGSNMCVICLDQEYNSVFIPCGHMCCCETCSSRVTSCPLCRSTLRQVVRIFRH